MLIEFIVFTPVGIIRGIEEFLALAIGFISKTKALPKQIRSVV
jgi:hypothetical protein